MKRRLHILNGPNLNLLGQREPEIYGSSTLADLEAIACQEAAKHNFEVDFRQSNHEGELVDWLHVAGRQAQGVILNAGAYTHTSLALHDAVRAIGIPVIELHLSNIFSREPMRHHSYIAPVARGVICGFGPKGYALAVAAMASCLEA